MRQQDIWLSHPGIRDIFTRLINMTDAQPVEERKRAVRFRVSPKTVPMLWNPPQPGEDAYLWKLIRRLDEEGYVRLKLGKVGPGQAEYESKPMLALNPEREGDIREIIGRSDRPGADAERWRQALQVYAHRFPGVIEKMAANPIRIPSRSYEEVVERLAMLPSVPANLYLREASARIFWGLSKVLDNREEALASLMDRDRCHFREKPVILHVHAASQFDVVFIENETTYIAACEGRYSHLANKTLVYAAGFKSSAARLKEPGGQLLHFTALSRPDACSNRKVWFDEALRGHVAFWGDLDFAGMGILKALRGVFPQTRAWEPGYEPMLKAVRAREGHSLEEGGKAGQVDPGETGCPYADSVLLPALREFKLTMDQEWVS